METTTARYFDPEPDSLATTGVGGGPTRTRTPSAPLEGGERYTLGKLLGRGGMGEVFAAYDERFGREVAIKRLHADKRDPLSLARFLREARIQGRLDHPAIPPVYELDRDDEGRLFFAMKKLSGHTLAHILRDSELRARFPRQRLLQAFVDVCLALELAHTRGVVHRDVKPSNILLGDFGEVYVLDWGVARMIDDSPRDGDDEPVSTRGAILGTPGYMAPEQVMGRNDIDGRADVFALGCVLFEILTDHQLYPRGDDGIRSVLRPIDARPSAHAEDVPPELDALCSRATTVSRGARIASARELGEGVQRYLEGDRDHALRARIADSHLDRAYAALAEADHEDSRRVALREAGRALALDPARTEAAEVIGRLVSTPPARTPRAVTAELDALDRQASRRYARLNAYIHASYLGLAVLLVVIYSHDSLYISLLAALACTTATLCMVAYHRPSRDLDYAIMAANVVTIALFARMFTPFLVAPGVGAITLARLAFHPAAHRRMLKHAVVACAAAILSVWLAEVVGLLSPTMTMQSGNLVLHSPIAGLDAVPGAPALCAYVIVLFGIAAALSYTSAHEQRMTRHRTHVQAWQLRQLVSR